MKVDIPSYCLYYPLFPKTSHHEYPRMFSQNSHIKYYPHYSLGEKHLESIESLLRQKVGRVLKQNIQNYTI